MDALNQRRIQKRITIVKADAKNCREDQIESKCKGVTDRQREDYLDAKFVLPQLVRFLQCIIVCIAIKPKFRNVQSAGILQLQ